MPSLPLAEHQLVALPRAVLAALRSAFVRDLGPSAAAAPLQEAGYAGGEALFTSFERWLREREDGTPPEDLAVARFERRASEYFREAGWGSLAVGTLGDAVVTLDSDDWWEDEPAGGAELPESFVTIGLFAGFFSRLAGEPLAVLQVESRAVGARRSRFLLGNAEVMDYVYDRLGRGSQYEEAVAGVV